MRGRRGVLAVTALALCGLGMPAVQAAAARASVPARVSAAGKSAAGKSGAGKPRPPLPVLGGGAQSHAGHGTAAAIARARQTGRPVVIPGLTTPTQSVTADTGGLLLARESVLPVRVRRGQGWVPVSTRLERGPAGFQPGAVPADTVSFSPGGSGPMAVIATGGAKLTLSWPGPLPAPAVKGSSATYRDVLPGVDLVLTATSTVSGGFSEVLVVRNAAAARDPGLAKLALRVGGTRTRLAQAAGGGLVAAIAGTSGSFAASPPRMWDSSKVLNEKDAVPAARQARRVGGWLAPMGSGPVSAVTGPAGGASMAAVRAQVRAGGGELSLLPDERLLASPATRFPVFIDPSFNFQNRTGDERAFDPVQSESGCSGSHYNDSRDYPDSPMGYDNFGAGSCQSKDTDYALYRVHIPDELRNQPANLVNASFKVTEVYSSSCSTDPNATVSWIGAINSRTGWPGPGRTADNNDAVNDIPPDSGSCNTVEDKSKRVSAGFDVTHNIRKAMGASDITFRVWYTSGQNGSGDETDHKQLTDNPTLQVVYNDTPDKPANLKVGPNNSGAHDLPCDTDKTDPNLPRIGKTDSTNGPYLVASYSDQDTDSVQGTADYWNAASPGTVHEVKTASYGSGTMSVQVPPSFTSGLKNGTVIGWKAEAQDYHGSYGGNTYGPYTSAWAGPCYFAVYPTAPDQPTVAPQFDTGTGQPVGSALKFTITQDTSDPAAEFVWSLDQLPPTTGTIPVSRTCSTSSSKTPDCVISGGTATLTITMPTPGPHDLFVYEQDAGGNDSEAFGQGFNGAADPVDSYSSGGSLQANFAAALAAGKPYDNTMISTQAGAPGSADADGSGDAFDEGLMKAAGWNPGKTVTIDGATFGLPNFGSATSGPDNLLAANQMIGAGPDGAQGSALVFLATSTNANVLVPGTATGAPDSGELSGDVTAPAVPGGTAVTGDQCSGILVADTTETGPCSPAGGQVNYNSGCPTGPTSYDLTVPGWLSTGASDISALTMPARDSANNGQQADSPEIYAFAVPVNPSCTITSVTLPDVAAIARASVTGSATQAEPTLHVFGIAVRNTTTATAVQPPVAAPAVAPCAAGCPSPAGQAWTGAFESSIESAFALPSGSGNQTVRVSASVNVSAAVGAQVRVRLSDPGFLSESGGTAPLSVGAASVAPAAAAPAAGQAPVPLTFGGGTPVTIPQGGDVYSDPLTLPFPVTAGQSLLVSLWIKNATMPALPRASWASGGKSWFSAPGSGDSTGDVTGAKFTGTGSTFYGAVYLMSGIDVTTPAVTSGGVTVSPGQPTVVVAGNNVTDPGTSSAFADSTHAPSQRLAGQLYSSGLAAGYGVVDAGIESNHVVTGDNSAGGISLLARMDRDILAEPDVGTVVFDEGLEDLLSEGQYASGAPMIDIYTILEGQAQAFGAGSVILSTLTPCVGYANTAQGDFCGSGSAVDGARGDFNSLIGTIGGAGCGADLDQGVSDGAQPEALQSAFDTGDHVNLNAAGYAALAQAVAGPLGCPLAPPAVSLPTSG
jgi:hypothetical protein